MGATATSFLTDAMGSCGFEPASCRGSDTTGKKKSYSEVSSSWHEDSITLGSSSDVDNVEKRVETLMEQLFRAHDLLGDGVLHEEELIKLNEKIQKLHIGKDADMGPVRSKFKTMFRVHLDPNGSPVPYTTYRNYMHKVLSSYDADVASQEAMLEQFLAEALSGRQAFRIPSFDSDTDERFKHLKFEKIENEIF